MKKRIVSVLLVVFLVILILPVTAQAAGSLSNFTRTNTYSGQFTDVPSGQWYAQSVQAAYEYGLIGGTSATTYSPGKNLTIAEAVKIAASLHSMYNTGSASFPAGDPWYQPYVDYALQNGIITSYSNYTANATRADFAVIFAKALPDEALTVKNTIADNTIPDVNISYSYGPAVYKLYRAGILTGNDSAGTYSPNSFITRDAVAAIITRMADPNSRKTVNLATKELSATEIAAKCSPAVFYVENYNKSGKAIASASGFFISSNGLAVTNYHVVDGFTAAKITTTDGKIYDVTGIVDYSEENDLALIQVNGTGFSYLEIGDSSTAVTGASIYAIGYPLGVDQTVTPGTISNASHTEDGVNYIIVNASISNGSSGGALVNTQGKVIGVTAASYSSGQNLNLAVPINLLSSLSQTKTPVSLATTYSSNYTFSYYPGYSSIPDFGSLAKAQVSSQKYNSEYNAQRYLYATDSLGDKVVSSMVKYVRVLHTENFTYDGVDKDDFVYYIDSSNIWEVAIGLITINGVDYVEVDILHA